MAFANFLKLQRRMLRVPLEQGKLLVGAGADVQGERDSAPKIRKWRGVASTACLERLNATVFLVVQSAAYRFIETPCGEVGLNASIDGLWAIVVEP
jgi:hypothetical protein